MERPYPRNHAQRQLEAARPVDAELGRVRLHPLRSLRNKRLSEALVTGKPVCLAERYEMRVTVQLPDNFFIARDQRVQIINPAPVSEGCSFAGRWIQMPVNRIAEAQFAEAQKIESAAKRLLGSFE